VKSRESGFGVVVQTGAAPDTVLKRVLDARLVYFAVKK
jgi:hypothetical protein